MQLFFIRHGQSTNNALYEISSSYRDRSEDPELTELGLQQAIHLAEFLNNGIERRNYSKNEGVLSNGFGITHLYCSLMVRAVETATQISRVIGLRPVAWPEIHEGGGIFLDNPQTGYPDSLPGKPRSFFQERYPELILPDWLGETGWWNRPFETRPERRARAFQFLRELLKKHGKEPHRVAVVSHGGFYNHFLAALLDISDGKAIPGTEAIKARNEENLILRENAGMWFELNNAAISRFDFFPEEIRIMYLNRVDFLPPELIT